MPWTVPGRVLRLGVLGLCALTLAASTAAHATDAARKPTAEDKAELDKFPAYSGPLNILEANAENGLHDFLTANEGKTVYLDLSIVRYVPIDPTHIDQPDVRASTDRFENPVFTKCWPDQKVDYQGILNFGEDGFPLPLNADDIEAGCATRIRFESRMLTGSAHIPKLWGDNKVQLFVADFFTVSKSTLANGKTLYTLTQNEDVSLETRAAYDTHKTTTHAVANLSLQQD